MTRFLQDAGWDTEYEREKEQHELPGGRNGERYTGRQSPVSSQLYLPGIYLDEYEPAKLTEIFGSKLLKIKVIPNRGTSFVFDDRGLKAGKEYYEQFKYRIATLIKTLEIQYNPKAGIILWTHYSNAEFANLAPTNPELKELMLSNGDVLHCGDPFNKDSKKSNDNLRLFPKGKSFNVRNLKIDEKLRVHIFDTTHLFAKGGLDKLGESIGFPKLKHPDWDKVTASQWLESNPNAFVDYAASDAAIPCEAAMQLYKGVRKIIVDLSNLEIIPTLNNKQVEKALRKSWMTGSSISETCAKLSLIQQNVWQEWINSQEILLQSLPEEPLTKIKGGLNKYFVSDKPQHFENVSAYDIKSAYLTALQQIKYPLWEPIQIGTIEKITLHNLAQENDKYHGVYLKIKYELPEGTNEWDRCVVFQNNRFNQGFTGRETGEYQWLSHFEIQAQAARTPLVVAKVYGGIAWEKKENGKVADFKPLMNTLDNFRDEYKKSENKAMADTAKLMGNGTYGKLAQQTNALNPDALHDSIMQDAKIHTSTHSDIMHSQITNPIMANWITSFIRSVLAITAAHNNALMAVTDSLLVSSIKWIESAKIKVPYGHLQMALNAVKWTREHHNVSAVVFRERDYYFYECQPKDQEKIKTEIKSGNISESSLEEIKVVKAAKLGRQTIEGQGKEEAGKQFAKESEQRFLGEPMEFTEKKLVSAKEMLKEGKTLNSQSDVERAIGCYNHRFMCDNHAEFERRVMLKSAARQKVHYVDETGREHKFADAWHMGIHQPAELEKLKKRCVHNPKHKFSIPQHIQNLIMVALDNGASSVRKLAEIVGIGKSTIHRWGENFKSAGESRQAMIRGGLDAGMYADPVAAITKYFAEKSAAGVPV